MPIVTKSLGDGTQSVLLTAAILRHVSARPRPVGISDMARAIGTSKSRIHRHVQTLVSCGFLSSVGGDGEYGVGPELVALASAISAGNDLASLAGPVMEALRERLGHTVIVSQVEPAGVRVRRSITGKSDIVVGIRPGTVLPFDRSAQGRVAMAFADRTRLADDSPLARARRDFGATHGAELQEIVDRGWASWQMREGLTGVAAPLFDSDGMLVGTLGLLDMQAAIGRTISAAQIDGLLAASHQLSGVFVAAGLRSPAG